MRILRWFPRRGETFFDAHLPTLGVVAMLALGLVVGGGLAVGSLDLLEDRYELRIVLADSGGLDPGDLVRVAGVDVGEVQAVEPDFARGVVVATLAVDRDVEVGDGATAKVTLNTLLGGNHVRLEDTTEGTPLASLPASERILDLDATSGSFTIIEALDVTTRAIQELDVDLLNRALQEVADATDGAGPVVSRLLADLDELSAVVLEREDDLVALVDDLELVGTTLTERDEQLVRLVEQTEVVLSRLETRRDELRAVLGDGTDVVEGLTAVLADNRTSLDTLLDDLHVVLEATEPRLDEVGQALARLPRATEGLIDAADNGSWLDIVLYSLQGLDGGVLGGGS